MKDISMKILPQLIKKTTKQFLTLAGIIAIGIVLYVSANVTIVNLEDSKEVYYDEIGFADYFFEVVLPANGVSDTLLKVSGIYDVDERIKKDVRVQKKDCSFVTGRIVTYDQPISDNINSLYLKEGRLFSEVSNNNLEIEIIMDSDFAKDNQFAINDKIPIEVNGIYHDVRLVGIGTSPELMAPTRNPMSVFEGTSFGPIMITKDDAIRLLGMDSINEIVISFTSESNSELAKESVASILSTYNILSQYGQKDNVSSKNFDAQIDGLRSATRLLPTLFFIITIGYVYINLKHLIEAKRTDIGIMKALGVGNIDIHMLFVLYSLSVAAIGTLLGIVFSIFLSKFLLVQYANFLKLPIRVWNFHIQYVWISILLVLIISIIASAITVIKISRIPPSEAMRPVAPPITRRFLSENFAAWQNLSDSWKITLRSMTRHNIRYVVTIFGISCTSMLIVSSMFFTDSRDYLLNYFFNMENNYDMNISFANPVDDSILEHIKAKNDITNSEGYLAVLCNFKFQEKTYNGILVGIESNSDLKRVYDVENKRIVIDDMGKSNNIIIHTQLAEKLGIQVGDKLQIETFSLAGEMKEVTATVSDISQQYVGMSAYTTIEKVNDFIGTKQKITGVFACYKEGMSLEAMRKIGDLQYVSHIVLKPVQEEAANIILGNLSTFTVIISLAAILLGLAIIYSSALMNLNERKLEVITLKVIGMRDKEIADILFRELVIEIIVGLLIGLPLGKYIGFYYIESIQNDFFLYPKTVSFWTYCVTVIFVAGVSVLGHFLTLRKLGRLKLTETLLERD